MLFFRLVFWLSLPGQKCNDGSADYRAFIGPQRIDYLQPLVQRFIHHFSGEMIPCKSATYVWLQARCTSATWQPILCLFHWIFISIFHKRAFFRTCFGTWSSGGVLNRYATFIIDLNSFEAFYVSSINLWGSALVVQEASKELRPIKKVSGVKKSSNFLWKKETKSLRGSL